MEAGLAGATAFGVGAGVGTAGATGGVGAVACALLGSGVAEGADAAVGVGAGAAFVSRCFLYWDLHSEGRVTERGRVIRRLTISSINT